MIEKRFTLVKKGNSWVVDDNSRKKFYLTPNEVVKLLNEQQELIEELQVSDEMGWKRAKKFEKECPKELHNKKMYIKRLEYKVQKFKEMNGEQQATIRKLQDLCGKSDYENAKLRIENKRLQEEIERLQKIIDLTQYQLKVQDRILKEVGE